MYWNYRNELSVEYQVILKGDRIVVPIFCFWASRPCGPAGRLALLLTKAGDIETNPGPTNKSGFGISAITYTR